MTQTTIPYTVNELIMYIWEENMSHFEFMENMNGGDCDCNLHTAMNVIYDIVKD